MLYELARKIFFKIILHTYEVWLFNNDSNAYTEDLHMRKIHTTNNCVVQNLLNRLLLLN